MQVQIFLFSMQMLFTMMQMRNVHMMHMSLFRDAIFMMRMSYWCMPWCKCPCRDAMNANARLGMQWMQVSLWEYAMMRMLCLGVCDECECPFVGMQWRRCLIESMPWCECFDANTIYSKKNSLYFRPEASTTPKTKIFSKLDLLFMKSHLPFWLKVPKKLVITIRKSLNGASTWNLMIWLKRFIIWLSKRGGTFPMPFSGKMNSLKIKHLKKIHFFSSWIWQDPPW